MYKLGDNEVVFHPDTVPAELTIPEGVTRLPDLFKDPEAVSGITSLHLPSTIKGIYSSTLEVFENLKSVTVAEGNENMASVDGVLYNYSNGSIMFVSEGVGGDIVVPDGISDIGTCFSGKAITSIVLPDSIYILSDGAFANCTELVSITFGKNVDTYSINVFEGCDKLELEEYGNAYYIGNHFIKPVSKDIV